MQLKPAGGDLSVRKKKSIRKENGDKRIIETR